MAIFETLFRHGRTPLGPTQQDVARPVVDTTAPAFTTLVRVRGWGSIRPMHPLLAHVQAEEAAFLETLEALVSHESPTRDKVAADTLAGYLEALLERDGWQVARDLR